jgi:hypothetical protein
VQWLENPVEPGLVHRGFASVFWDRSVLLQLCQHHNIGGLDDHGVPCRVKFAKINTPDPSLL